MPPHNPTCSRCGNTLATWEIQRRGLEKDSPPLTNQKCFDCRNKKTASKQKG